MNNSTRHKTQEAEYFLNQIKQFFEDDNVFAYNFSAFLSAARSITLHMQKQYKRRDGFPKWYCQNQIDMSADKELVYLKKVRNKDIHVEKIQTVATRQVSISANAYIAKKNEIKSKELLRRVNQLPAQNKNKTVRRFLPKFKNEDVVPFCERQMKKLTKLVDECEKQFLKLKD